MVYRGYRVRTHSEKQGLVSDRSKCLLNCSFTFYLPAVLRQLLINVLFTLLKKSDKIEITVRKNMVNNFVLVSAIIYNICQVKQDLSYKKQLTEKTTVIRNYQQQVNKFSPAFSSKLLCPFILLSLFILTRK